MAPPPDIKDDLPTAMMMAAFVGISWYIGLEVNTSLFLVFKNRRRLYFWSCFLCSWGVVLQPLFIILADFGVWTDLRAAITMIYLTWLIMVPPQSWVLYSRLHLVMGNKENLLRWIGVALAFTTVLFTVPTLTLGIITQTTTNAIPARVNMIWDRFQATMFCVQETCLSAVYIYQTQLFLRDNSLLQRSFDNVSRGSGTDRLRKNRTVLWQLIYTNILIIALDVALLGIVYANLFYVQGAFKPCVYGMKLRIEFVVLNRLIKCVGHRQVSAPTGSDEQTILNDSVPMSPIGSGLSTKGSRWSRSADFPAVDAVQGGGRAAQSDVELVNSVRPTVRIPGEAYPLERQDSRTPINP